MKLYYVASRYLIDNSLGITAYTPEDELFGTVTVNLCGCGMTPPEGYIYIPTYKMSELFVNTVLKDLVDEVVGEVRIGHSKGLFVKLKPEWKSLIRGADCIEQDR